MALFPQAALETAVLRTIAALPDASTRTAKGSVPNAGRTFDGEPPPGCGPLWISVWSGGDRKSQSKTALDQVFGVSVTVTLRAVLPLDNWVVLRDRAERLHCLILAAIHRDCLNNTILREASALLAADGTGQKVGFREALMFQGLERCQRVGPDWFSADVERSTPADAGVAQTANYHGAKLLQALATME